MKKNVSEPIRVLQIGMHNEIGGIETYLMNYYRNIDRDYIQFDFINPYDQLCFQEEITSLGGKIYNVVNFKKHPYKFYKELKEIIRENNYQIVHVNMMSAANILPIIVAKKCNVKHIIAHSHNANTPSGIFRKILNKMNKQKLLKYATDFFACSHLAGEWMFGTDTDFTIINNAIDLKKFEKNKTIRLEKRKELNIDDKFVIGHVGRFCYQKNHEFLINVYYELQKKTNNAILFLIGAGELKNEIKEKVKKLNLADKVFFLDTTNKVNEYLQIMDMFVLTSRFEGLPVVGIEAQAAQLKCLFSDKITQEVKLIDTTDFLPINDCKLWADYINNYMKSKNNKVPNTEKLCEYNIIIAAKKIEKI